MDGLRQQAKNKFFSEQEFSPQNGPFCFVEALAYPSTTFFNQESVGSRSLIDRVTRTPPELSSDKPIAGLQLLRIDRHPYGRLQTTKSLFLSLFNAFELEPYALHMLQRESYGFNHFQTKPSSDIGDVLDTFYLKTISLLLIWSHNRSSAWTRAILIPRHSDSVGDSCEIFRSFVKALELQRDLIAHSWLLRFVALLETHHWIESILTNELETLRRAESQTGYGCWESWNQGGGKIWKPQQDKFTEMSQTVGFSATALANVSRHIKIADELGDIVPLLAEAADSSCVVIREEGGSSLSEAAEALKLVRKQIAARMKDTEYLQERARNQLSVIFNLINQNDATTSLQIASSAKDDSASMRVLALMAMFFLPGTFFATLFALPTLTWSEDVVVSSRFWIYWAFTLPCTLLLVALYKGWGLIDCTRWR